MRLDTVRGLPAVSLLVRHARAEKKLSPVLVDTGSASTILSLDAVLALGIRPEATDPVFLVRGIGGTESVFGKRIDRLQLGSISLEDMDVEIGSLDYGISLQGILGMDVLRPIQAVIDLGKMDLRGGDESTTRLSG